MEHRSSRAHGRLRPRLALLAAAVLLVGWPLAASATTDRARGGDDHKDGIVLDGQEQGGGRDVPVTGPDLCVGDRCVDLPGEDGHPDGPGDEGPGPGDLPGGDGPPPGGGDFPSVPEPGTMLLLGAGLAGLAIVGRKRS